MCQRERERVIRSLQPVIHAYSPLRNRASQKCRQTGHWSRVRPMRIQGEEYATDGRTVWLIFSENPQLWRSRYRQTMIHRRVNLDRLDRLFNRVHSLARRTKEMKLSPSCAHLSRLVFECLDDDRFHSRYDSTSFSSDGQWAQQTQSGSDYRHHRPGHFSLSSLLHPELCLARIHSRMEVIWPNSYWTKVMKCMAWFDVRAVSTQAVSIISTPIRRCTRKEARHDRLHDSFDVSVRVIVAMKLHYGDLNDSSSLVKIIASVKPMEIYNLGAMSHVKVRWAPIALGTMQSYLRFRSPSISVNTRPMWTPWAHCASWTLFELVA